MTDPQDRIRQIQEELAELQRRNDEEFSAPAPAVVRGRIRGWPFVGLMLIGIFVFGELSLTVQGYTNPDFRDRDLTGQATVVSCERHGPIGYGIGYWDRCTADIVWDGGFAERKTFTRRNFLGDDEVGRTVTIGRGSGFKGGGYTYSRPELPNRPLVTAAGVVLALPAVIPALLLILAVLFSARDGLQKLIGRGRAR
ncbi:DUF6346 domain-containing protein [Winogradskya humida]|uniref:DUF3592 domain-containing protein n=1 Tax=Winogradskya humida TaxID=113566 RepID=A0ABQ3ZGG4_9ACTN|nr:DUF6346 domain-containing protein [Actinoplanes humidus]GIE17657.1 hypothetical protein Ahu01nite_007590 [Actinoplanes humidus]